MRILNFFKLARGSAGGGGGQKNCQHLGFFANLLSCDASYEKNFRHDSAGISTRMFDGTSFTHSLGVNWKTHFSFSTSRYLRIPTSKKFTTPRFGKTLVHNFPITVPAGRTAHYHLHKRYINYRIFSPANSSKHLEFFARVDFRRLWNLYVLVLIV